MNRHILLILLSLGSNTALAQNHWVASVTATAQDQSIDSFSYAEYVDANGSDGFGYVTGSHCLDNDQPQNGASYCESFDVFNRAYSGHFNLPSSVGCHKASLYAQYTSVGGVQSDSTEQNDVACITPPPPPPPPPPTCRLNVYANAGGSVSQSDSGGYGAFVSKGKLIA